MWLVSAVTAEGDVPGLSLRELAASRGTRIGAAVNADALATDADYRTVLAREFNVLTAENAMKWAVLRASRDRFDFEQADAIVAFAEAHGMAVRGHTLVWHNALPEWLIRGNYTREQLMDLLREHIQTVVGRYRGRVFAWDVVNEAVMKRGALRDTFWLRGIGPEYIDLAFQWAHEADPDALLFYNDFVAEGGGRRSKTLYRFLEERLGRGVPIHGVGLQMHLSIDNLPRKRCVVAAIRRFESLGLHVHITELDVRLRTPASGTALERQAQVYASAAEVLRDCASCTDLVMWGVDDGHSWIPHFVDGWGDALLFDAQYRPKPAYHAVQKVLGR
jgi:endo-1,4-beta-xylanase